MWCARFLRTPGGASSSGPATRSTTERQSVHVLVEDEAGGAVRADFPSMDEAVWGKLPEDVLVQVLRRVPLLSHFRFRCVCKSWQLMLSDPKFVTLCPPLQGMCSLGPNPGLPAGVDSFTLPDRQLRVRTISLSFLPRYSFLLLASDNGLLLLGVDKGLLLLPLCWQTDDEIHLFVCNPVNRSSRELPPLRADMADEIWGTFLDVNVAAKTYRVVVVASYELRQLIFVYESGAGDWKRMDWWSPLPGQHELVLCDGVVHGFWSDCGNSPRMKLLSFSLDQGSPLRELELARPQGAHLTDSKLTVLDGCLVLAGSLTTFQGFGIWKLNHGKTEWELVSTAPDELFLKSYNAGQCPKLVTKVSTLGDFICIEYDVVRDHRTDKWVEEMLAFHTRKQTWHPWHLPGLADPIRGILDRKLVPFDPRLLSVV